MLPFALSKGGVLYFMSPEERNFMIRHVKALEGIREELKEIRKILTAEHKNQNDSQNKHTP
jgi:hypothetical protein